MRLLFLPLLLLLACCGGSHSQPKQALRINIQDEPQALDPRKARDLPSIAVMHMLFEGLTRIGKEGAVELALAESCDVSEDGLCYTFHLRKAFWSNGSPVTSTDFAKSWRRVLDPSFPSDVAYQLFAIKGAKQAKMGEGSIDQIAIQTPDPQTLVVELEQPMPYFLELLSFPSLFAVSHLLDEQNPRWMEDVSSYVSNGPFALKEWKHSDRIKVMRNPSYWDAKNVKLRQIDLMMVNPDTELRMFSKGEIDWAGSPLSNLPGDSLGKLNQTSALKIKPLSGTFFLRVNTADPSPLSHPLFRRALSQAIDREKIAVHILQGGQMPALSLVPPVMGLGFEADAKGQQEAQRLLSSYLSEAGRLAKDLEPITILYVTSDRNHLIAQTLQQQIEGELGIPIKLEAVERKRYYERLSKKQFQLAAGSWIADFNDPINFLEVFKYKESGSNNTGWEHPKYIEWLNLSAVCKDSEERKALLHDAEQLLMEHLPIIPVFHYALNYLQREEIQDVSLSPIGQIDFRWAHLEEKQVR